MSSLSFPDRESALEELRKVIQKVIDLDSTLGVNLDATVHALETFAFEEGIVAGGNEWRNYSKSLLEERNAARADLDRIKMIVNNPLIIMQNEPVLDGQVGSAEQPQASQNVT
jgi:predicted transcriptional regulator